MSLAAVHMPADVYYACLTHALSVETEEVMGLLIGKVTRFGYIGKPKLMNLTFQFDGENAHIMSVIVLQRSDKRKDRVEISTEQLHTAMVKTLELSEAAGESINVLGWYHSHPHITVQPSHVDLRTQTSYQMMDTRFVGIIISVFNEDKTKGQEVQITCFQAAPSDKENPYKKVDVPLHIVPGKSFSSACSEAIFQLPQILSEEDKSNFTAVKNRSKDMYLTQLQNESAFVMSQCHILKTIVNPMLLSAEMRTRDLLRTCRELEREKTKLLQQRKQ